MLALDASERPVDLVLQGGGIRAIAIAGALAALSGHGFRPRRMAGASAGAIVAGLTVAGYTSDELRQVVLREPFTELLDDRWYTRLPAVGRPLALLWRLGLHPGDRLLQRLAELLEDRGVRTYGDLRTGHDVDPLRVVVSDVTGRRLLVFPRDAVEFGIEPDRFSVALSLRMSAGIPVIYEPVRLRARGREHLLVDGGMLSNFPLWVFDDCSEPETPVIGLRLVDALPGESFARRLPVPGLARTRLGVLIDYVESLARTMMEAHDRRYIDAGEIGRVIPIPVSGVSTTQFDLDPDGIEALWRSGELAVNQGIDAGSRFPQSMIG